jgi:signal transduction histidine kinase
MKSDELRNELLRALNTTPLDYGKVLDLSTRLAKLDPVFVRFSVDAGHISRLGKELVGRKETAVSELVKNAYDADATSIDLIFRNAGRPGGQLLINDDGHGMTREKLIDGFMRISTTDKIHAPLSPIYRRQRAGRKGIGRFAAQRLGRSLVLTTQPGLSDCALRLVIDWDQFEHDQELSGMASRVEIIPKENKNGTTLLIDGLREAWSDADIKRVYSYVADLIQPFPLSKKDEENGDDPGFKANFYKRIAGINVSIADERTMIFNQSLAVIEGRVDGEGFGLWSFECSRFGLKEVDNRIAPSYAEQEDQPYERLRDIRLHAYYFIHRSGLIPGQYSSTVQETLRRKGGIKIYRNGFRVLPYGEATDDWLRLDASTRAREILPPHANNNFLGFVELYDPTGEHFDETSSREGLIENEDFQELIDFASRSLKAVVLRIASARERKKTAGQRDWETKKPASTTEKLRDTADHIEHLASSLATSGNVVEAVQSTRHIASQLKLIASEQEEITRDMLEELGMLRVLASLGLTISQFTHESRHYLGALRADLNSLRESSFGLDVEPVQRMAENLNTVYSYTSYFDRVVSDNVSREMLPLELRDVVNRFVKVTRPLAERYGILIMEPEISGYDLYAQPMHPSEWASILFNLFTNSKKAIKRAEISGRILIRAGTENGSVFLDFADNGTGISPEIQDKIFDAFFTTTNPTGTLVDEQEEMVGTGLGLKIVKDIVTGANGEICLMLPPSGYKTCFRIRIPLASEEEVDKYEH